MANEGCPHEGSDHRLFGRWGCKIQTALSFHSTREPWQLLFRLPPYMALIIPIGHYPDGRPKYFSLRIGFRWDPHWGSGGYIFPEAILKVMDHVVL